MSAFVAVPTQTSLLNASAVNNRIVTMAEPTQEPKKQQAWSPAIRDYVGRSFAAENVTSDVSKQEIELKLRDIINHFARLGSLDDVDWKTYPLPQMIIRQERIQHMTERVSLSTAPIPTSQTTSAYQSPTTNKRKSVGAHHTDNGVSGGSTAPWRSSTAPANSLESRMSFQSEGLSKRAEKRQKRFQEAAGTLKESSKFSGDLDRRKQRFAVSGGGYSPASRDDAVIPDTGPVIGTCQDLEKRYFRLTAPPKPEAVRPLEVLKETLKLLTKKWRAERNYNYICDQFKSMRQDLTVQHVTNEFTVNVYELHARIALEKGDLGEYNQCQTQLRALYKRKLGGHPGEFLAYRILYFIYTSNRTDLNSLLADLTAEDQSDPAVRHALQTRSALALGNYRRFFKLYMNTPNMGVYLMDRFIARERISALASICKTYKPDVSLDFVSKCLAFETDEDCAKFLAENGGEALIEIKDGGKRFASGKAGSIFELAKAQAFRGVDIKGQI